MSWPAPPGRRQATAGWATAGTPKKPGESLWRHTRPDGGKRYPAHDRQQLAGRDGAARGWTIRGVGEPTRREAMATQGAGMPLGQSVEQALARR
jgi:hypothetical protein